MPICPVLLELRRGFWIEPLDTIRSILVEE